MAKPRSQKVILSTRKQWSSILRSITKDEVPIDFLISLTIRLNDLTLIEMNIKHLFELGFSNKEIEQFVNDEINCHGKDVTDVEYLIDIASVVNIVVPLTNRLLNQL